jgi:murein DD-endopeptidase MepM/ murein hydrolase activator NlpD
VIVPLGLLLVAFALTTTSQRLEAFSRSPFPLGATPAFHPAITLHSAPAGDVVPAPESVRPPVELVLGRGETLDALLGRLGLGPAECSEVAAAFRAHCDLRRLRPGDVLAAALGPGDRLERLELAVRDRGRVLVARADTGSWSGRFEEFVEDRRLHTLEGTLDSSLTEAISAAGGPVSLAFTMADVLQWDLDFNRDLQKGDRFQVLYEEVYLDGRAKGVGDVLALRYDNAGDVLEAYRYGDDPAYYDAEGRPLQKMFLRSPLPFSRVTSRFSNRRFHPVLKVYRPHYGVDYGAPVGTAARTTARGTVIFAGWSGGGGNTVKIRHANGYVTAYLHLSRFARGVTPGARVAQGDVVGYVGSTGLATGPHLDYRVQKDGRWIDPMSLNDVEAEPLSEGQLAGYVAWRDALRQSLLTGEAPRLGPEQEGLQLAAQGRADAVPVPAVLHTAG